MSINTIASPMTILSQRFVSMRKDLLNLQQQLGTGRASDTFGGLGTDRDLALAFRSNRSAAEAYRSTISTLDVRMQVMQTSVTRLQDISLEAKGVLQPSVYQLADGSQTAEQKVARTQLDEMASLLNTQVDGRYLFSGLSTDTEPVVSIDKIIEGDGSRAGFRQVMSERRQADLGATGLGRLTVASGPGDGVTLEEDAAGHPFGFKISGISTTSSAIAVTGPTGGQDTVTAELTSLPTAGEKVRITLDMPDGTSTAIELTATNSATPGAGAYTIGADTATTAANLQAALTTALGKAANTELAAASAYAAADNFFNIDDANPPLRVAGPPYDSATALVAGTSTDTVSWYVGESGAGNARQTATARIDQGQTISYGARANELALRNTFQNLAVVATQTFSSTNGDAIAEYDAMATRLRTNLDDPSGAASPKSVSVDIAAAQRAMAAADDRHTTTTNYMDDLIDGIEGVDTEDLAAKILTVQTRLEATYSVTSMLSQLSLTNYL
ncbi:MAG: flagellar biosynthesis protein FlgL [Hyphomicrobiales bacterium]